MGTSDLCAEGTQQPVVALDWLHPVTGRKYVIVGPFRSYLLADFITVLYSESIASLRSSSGWSGARRSQCGP